MRRRRKRRNQNSSPGAARALALFAILCGAIAFAASFGHGGEASAENDRPTGPDPAAISRALDHLESATHALDATDYGRTRFHLHESRRTLTNALK